MEVCEAAGQIRATRSEFRRLYCPGLSYSCYLPRDLGSRYGRSRSDHQVPEGRDHCVIFLLIF